MVLPTAYETYDTSGREIVNHTVLLAKRVLKQKTRRNQTAEVLVMSVSFESNGALRRLKPFNRLRLLDQTPLASLKLLLPLLGRSARK